LLVRKAVAGDVKAIHKLVNEFAEEDKIIPRSLNDLYENLRDFFICVDDNNRIIGACALHISWEDLAEIRSLAVARSIQKQGVGTTLIEKALEEARQLGIKRVFSLTYIPKYFEQFGFQEKEKSELPHKIWGDCMKCHKFPDCDEIAVILNL
jgi:amino-acid N-acetyltransferase